jgi:hypothetical protein
VSDERAFSLSPEKVAAFGIIFGEFQGGVFDFNSMQWKPRT